MQTLQFGSSGPLVQFLQNILQKLGFYQSEIDGIFGFDTQNSVKAFQRNFGIFPIDGIVGTNTWQKLSPYINGDLGFIVPTNINYSYSILQLNLNTLKQLYPFLEFFSAGTSVAGNDIPVIKLGRGQNEVFYSFSIHANEWISSTLVMKFVADFCYAYVSNLPIFGYNARNIFNHSSIYIMPMVNPDGVNLVTGEITPLNPIYLQAQNIASNFPYISFPSGWKANINGVDLNLQFPAGWINAKNIKYSQGYTQPAPRDFVGYVPLTEPEALAIYDFTLMHNFRLVISFHTQGKVIYWRFQNYNPPESLAIGRIFAQVSGYSLEDTPYNSSFAGYKDWFIQDFRKPGYTIELGEGVSPLPVSQFDEIYNDTLGILVLGAIL